MTRHRRTTPFSGDRDRDPRVTRLLREEYRAPSDPAYWDGLESRILAYVRATPPAAAEWWEAFAGWTRVGLVAAAVAVAVALSALLRTRDVEARVAYEAVVEQPPATLASARLGRTAGAPEREADFRYVIEP